ncbi:ABC transporter permease subunit [Flavobacteriales bacterium]|mgnify:FL=1|nr:ABC transporter permease subunit [Flavobacteriales bacterium]
MITLYKKEISIFFSTIIGYLIIGLFLLISSLILWHDISEINILDNAYASMDSFFSIAPLIFLLFIPSVSMRVFSEEFNTGTIETLITKPISSFEIVTAKFFAVLSLVIIAILPTITYVISIYFLGETTGNLDLAAVVGSYIGLLLLSSIFSSISVYASSLSSNQIVAFILAIIMSSFFFFGFDILSQLPYLQIVDLTLQKIGISYHYNMMSKGLLKVSDLVYFMSVSLLFIKLTEVVIKNKKT